MLNSFSDSYAAAGVDVTAGYETVERIKPLVKSTFREGVLGGLGGFGGLFEPNIAGMERPVFVSGTDGVGTKLKVAFMMNKHDTVGIDCVAMCVNDIICCGAEPLFFLDYLALGKNIPARTEQLVKGIADGCRQAGCALVGGETAEMPGFYPEDEYDMAGFAVGVVDHGKIIDGSTIAPGDRLIGLASSGLHSNGFSLVRKVLDLTPDSLEQKIPEFFGTLGEELIRPTRIYVRQVLHLIKTLKLNIKGICHITGGGLYENVPRMLPDDITAVIRPCDFPESRIFSYLTSISDIPVRDMYNTFNMGIGLVMAVDQADVGEVLNALIQIGEHPYVIGSCVKGEKGVELSW
ncbi:phosphoribosylformylglycinamidine cyclo-ligase [Sporobacter termitidis DSM 10068]|uniref:Phosphoribosylformylglycinamidine cyclo-ligase n=1 Tax=Sporobacter termitidis DSM 10068 TaxID=1123282 RepID=A0A1M5X5C6_9FIRM|nr:phosphoribosylformylglycinamidine cyclo-ligase [Sporobacter termitidis]SHH94981.1 phosphoribosylformylglycinamidine cyclo-ligase [Sporobacter termitidis DSM 10068]